MSEHKAINTELSRIIFIILFNNNEVPVSRCEVLRKRVVQMECISSAPQLSFRK